MKALRFEAGQTITYIVELDFSRENITPDWSLTAWAPKGAVEVRHSDGLKSQASFPYIEKKESKGSHQSTNKSNT